MDFLLCTLTPEVQCRLVHRNHKIWRTKITKFWRNGNDSKQPSLRTRFPRNISWKPLFGVFGCFRWIVTHICSSLGEKFRFKKTDKIVDTVTLIRTCNNFKSNSICTKRDNFFFSVWASYINKGNNKITELRTILQRESQNS